MKDREIFVYCEYCDAAHELISPPTDKQYKNGFIQIRDGVVLLNNLTIANSHSFNLDGYYCNSDCLSKQIKKIREINVAG